MNLAVFTLVHVLLSLTAIGCGFVVLYGLLTSKRFDRWTALFLITTVTTSATGFLFPFHQFLPSHGVGMISLLVLAVAIPARYAFHLMLAWRKTYVVSAIASLYLNVFVLVAQLFQKVHFLKALAPTQTELPFFVTQLLVLILFVVFTLRALSTFRSPMLIPA
jgi:hypothetical protein